MAVKNEKHGKHKKHFKKIEKPKATKKKNKISKRKEEPSGIKKEGSGMAPKSNYKGILAFLAAIVGLILLIFLVVSFLNSHNEGKLPQQTDEGVLVASVNGEPIYSNEISERMRLYQSQYGPSFTEDVVINETIKEVLLLQEAENKGIEVSRGEVDSAVNDWLQQLRQSISDEDLEYLLAAENLTMDQYVSELRESVKVRILITSLLDEVVLSEIDDAYDSGNITEDELRSEYERNEDIYNKVKVRHILICHEDSRDCDVDRSREEARDLSDEIWTRIVEGESFANLAEEYSACPSSSDGGELGWFVRGQMVKNFSDASFELNKNQFTRPVPTEFGYHIIKLLDEKNTFEELKDDVRLQMDSRQQGELDQQKRFEQEEAVASYVDSLWEEAEIIFHRKQLKEGLDLENKE